MKVYSYRDIKNITEEGILFKDGFILFFEVCKNEWLIDNNLKEGESHCVAERNLLAYPPYFLFYSKDKVKILFDNKGIFGKKKNRKKFENLQVILNRLGFSSYDMS